MRRCLSFLLPVFLTGVVAKAQLINDGATITIQPGAIVICAGNIENRNAGTITNNGKLEVQGNYLNTATYNNTVGADDSLIFSGGGNSTVNGGASTYHFVLVNKTANTDFLTLTNDFTVGSKLIYNSGTLSTDPVNTVFKLNAPALALFEFAPGREIIGRVRRTGWANGVATVFNQPNMQITTAGGTAPTEFTVNMIPEADGGDPSQSEREVKRKFVFSQVGGSGYTADARFPYAGSELNSNIETNLVPWSLPAAEWTGCLTAVSRDAANDWVSVTGIAEADVAQEWKLADPRYTVNATVYLRGSWNSSTLQLNTTLNSSGLIPLNHPYNTTPFNYTGVESVGSIPNANVVDWVLVELRKPASGLPADATSTPTNTIIGRKAGFLLKNGTIVDLDGITPISFDIKKQGTGNYMVIRHRNHLDVMSNALASNAAGAFANDFSDLANVYKIPANPSLPVCALPNAASKYGMWAGDANKSRTINSGDITVIQNAIALGTSGYQFADVNLSGTINSGDITVTQNTIGFGGSGSASPRMIPRTSHVPGEIKNE